MILLVGAKLAGVDAGAGAGAGVGAGAAGDVEVFEDELVLDEERGFA